MPLTKNMRLAYLGLAETAHAVSIIYKTSYMKSKKFLHKGAVFVLASAVSLFAVAVLVSAQATPPVVPHPPQMINVDGSGNILVRGTVVTVGASSVTVNSWGGNWTIQPAPTAQMFPVGPNGGRDLSGIRVGDFLGVDGTIAPGQSFSVSANVIHDWTTAPAAVVGVPNTGAPPAASGSATIPAGESLYTGTVSNLGTDTFTLTDDLGNSYMVSVPAGAIVWNNARTATPLSSVQPGDAIRIDGTLSGTTITASVVRDTSL